ncbi:MAG: hypothetical protein K2N24_03330 [Lachnospiraceae bacterium]|nr:hypothetical protein [Lachnospiraceae bacterium]
MNKMKTIWKLSRMELMQLMRSTKIIILALFAIFINIQIITPLRALSITMEHKLSIFEPFAAIGNSGVVVLILPLFFITMMADFPREGESRYFYQIRCSKRTWVMGQIVYGVECSIMLTLFVFAASVLLSLDFISWSPDYSYAVTRYVALFPEWAGEYVVQLIPENLYNQIPLPVAVVHTVLLLILYFIMLAMLILVFSLVKKKIAGLFLDGIIILLGTITCAGRMAYMWVFPMAHTITWLHYAEYQSKPVLPLCDSYLYFSVINAAFIVLSIIISKRYNGI